jgi:hypothetical protein
MVCLSRISPIRMQSGACRSAVLQRGLETLGVGADLALVDDGFLVLEDELDRILQRQDVADFCSLRKSSIADSDGRLARAGGADHQDQAALLQISSFSTSSGRPKVSNAGTSARDEADHHGGRALLTEGG